MKEEIKAVVIGIIALIESGVEFTTPTMSDDLDSLELILLSGPVL